MRDYKLIYTLDTGLVHGLPLRFFVYDPEANDNEGDIVETDMLAFEEAEGVITWERNTVFENGVSQICLTKMPRG